MARVGATHRCAPLIFRTVSATRFALLKKRIHAPCAPTEAETDRAGSRRSKILLRYRISKRELKTQIQAAPTAVKKRLEVPNRPEPRTTAHVSFGCLAKPQLSEGRRSELRIITATATPKQLPQKRRILLSADRKPRGYRKQPSPPA